MGLYLGTNYHPHDWPKERWEEDFQLMRQAGFTTVRLGHLCWDSYEPQDGQYTFEWFDEVMELCMKYGLNVVLDVSMHPAPTWVHQKCSGCNIVSKGGNVQPPVTRYMEDVADPEYQFYALRFGRKLVNRYKAHPALLAFGLCNEQGAGFLSYSEYARKRFIEWLRRKYGSVEELNTAWATRRWSRRLSTFEDVVFPENECAVGAPEAWLDMRRFFGEGASDFLGRLRRTVEENAPGIPHASNHYSEFARMGFDYLNTYQNFVDYPAIGFYPGYAARDSRDFQVTVSGYMERISESDRPMWCLEFITGGVGIQYAHEGINRMYAFWCLLHRAQMVLGWTFRSMNNGEEQFLYGLLNHDGLPNDNYREYARIAEDFKKLEKYGFPYLPLPEIAVADSFDSRLVSVYHPRQFRMPYEHHAAIAANVLERRNLDYNIVGLSNMKKQYKLIVVPGYIVMDEGSAATLRAFVEQGGTVVMTGYSATVDENGRVFDTARPGRLSDVFGIRIDGFTRTSGLEMPKKEYERLPRNQENGREILQVCRGDQEIRIEVDYYEKLTLLGAEEYAVEKNHQVCVVSKNHYGSGTAYYAFSETNEEILGWLLDQILDETGIKRQPAVPESVQVREIAAGQTFYLNLSNDSVEIPLCVKGYGVLSEKDYERVLILEPYDGELVVSDIRNCARQGERIDI